MLLRSRHHTIVRACLIALSAVGCSSARPPQAPASTAMPPRIATTALPSAPVATIAPTPDLPASGAGVPPPLTDAAASFGLTMLGDGWTWKALSQRETRFDWSGRPASGDRELLYSFWMPKLDDTVAIFLPQIVASAAANLSDRAPCQPFDQPAEIVKMLGVDRVITVCFEPMAFYAKEFRQGVLHGVVHHGALTIVVALSNDRGAVVPLATTIGARGARDQGARRRD
jgi:hypothetical protein